jgi:hypothetical protein
MPFRCLQTGVVPYRTMNAFGLCVASLRLLKGHSLSYRARHQFEDIERAFTVLQDTNITAQKQQDIERAFTVLYEAAGH